jgi:predicted Zn-dependent protease
MTDQPNPKLDTFRQMVAKNPDNLLARFGLANEALKAGLYDEAREHLETYLARYDDEGNGYGRLADALQHLGRTDDARDALRRGVAVSHRFGHPSMAAEFEARIEELDDEA